ncbi:DUF6366 family protein [Chengkuizengella sediminis]|uniref:DUF6366 family protein n=1 Tax=Chengkuizengella sediminis TaxID=1885917 RepID=UPI001389BC62|nr:DUF6366 family protein [Chengkuizengella sediminis]NDI35472.1 hypothetical protein [Chengkuizengella sediminis]
MKENNKETPARMRERLRQEELRKNTTTGKLADSINKAQSGNLADLVGDLSWKVTGILILVLIIGILVASIFLK